MKRIVIGGIGNVLLGDDGLGPYVISLLEARYSFPDFVELVDFGTPSLDLLEHVADSRAVILIDAAKNDAAPGTLTVYSKVDVLRLDPGRPLDPHSPALGATLAAAELLGNPPDSFLLIGITPETISEGPSLSESAMDAAERAVDLVIKELEKSGIPVKVRQPASCSSSFWTELNSREPATI